jgi:hypothetical protein
VGIPGGDDSTGIEDDPSTAVGMVRLLITDVDPASALFTDEQIEAFLTAEGDSAKRAAASLLMVIARSEVLLAKKITTQDLSTDGPAVAKELRASAAELKAEAAAEEAAADSDAYGLDVVPLWSFDEPVPWGSYYL